MARNEEKALTLFNKWQTFKKDFHANESNRRPLFASECQSIPDAEKVRRELVQGITKKISAIKNASLGEHRLRELNDEINKLLRQKHFWEGRIRELGGTVPIGKQYYDIEGKELPGAPGYKYFGAAKDLPGVREIFSLQEDEEAHRKQQTKRSRTELYKHISPDYYGFRDDDDGLLQSLEIKREKELLLGVSYKRNSTDSDEESDALAVLPNIAGGLAFSNNSTGVVRTDVPSEAEVSVIEAQKARQLEVSKQSMLNKLQIDLL